MKKQYISLLVVIIGVCGAYSIEQELITLPKNKKKYVSEQQCIELEGDIVVVGTNVAGALADLSKTVFLVIKSALNRVNDHVEGEKNSLGKVERTECYAKKMKIMHELEHLIEEAQKIKQRLDGFMASLVQ